MTTLTGEEPDEHSPPAAREHGPRTDASPRSGWGLWLVTLLAGAAAGAAGWLAGEGLYGYFGAPMNRVETMGYVSYRATPEALKLANIKNAVAAYGAFGGVLGVTLGLVGGLCRRSFVRGVMGGLLGGIVGMVLTGLLTAPALFGYWRYFGEAPHTGELLVPLASHAVCWAGIGLAGGLALGLGAAGDRMSVVHAMIGGLIGAIVGAVAFEFAGAAFFSMDKTTLPISASPASRFTARMAVALGVTFFALKGLPRPRREA